MDRIRQERKRLNERIKRQERITAWYLAAVVVAIVATVVCAALAWWWR